MRIVMFIINIFGLFFSVVWFLVLWGNKGQGDPLFIYIIIPVVFVINLFFLFGINYSTFVKLKKAEEEVKFLEIEKQKRKLEEELKKPH
jgi:hypothetical protein